VNPELKLGENEMDFLQDPLKHVGHSGGVRQALACR